MDIKGDRVYVANTGEDSISIIDENSMESVGKIYMYTDNIRPPKSSGTNYKPMVGPHSIKANVKTERLYTANCFGNSISIIDIKENRVLDTVSVGSFPHCIAIDDTGSYIYVTNQDSDSLCILRADNFKVIAYIPIGSMPQGICLSPDNKLIAVASAHSHNITILNSSKTEISGCITAPYNPCQLVFTRDGCKLYATGVDDENSKNGTILVIDIDRAKIIKRVQVGEVPIQLCLHPYNNILYVTNTGSGDIYVLDTCLDKVINRVKVDGMVHGVIINKKATRLFVSNIQYDSVIVLDTANYQTRGKIGVGREPHSLCIF